MNRPEHAQQERARLSTLLRQLRAAAGLTSNESAVRAGFSQSKLSKIENGLLLPSEADVKALCRAYRATAPQRRDAVDLVGRLQTEIDSTRVILQRGAYRKQQQIRRIENDATLFRDFQPTFVLGLLQTPAYMRRVFAGLPPDEAERAIEVRLVRQQVLHNPAKQFNLIMTEAALRWRPLPPSEMIAQIDHIAAVARLPGVRLGLIAWTTEVSAFPGHAFHIYDDALVIVGTLSATASIRDPRDIKLYTDLFSELEALASHDGEADAVLDRIRTDLERLI